MKLAIVGATGYVGKEMLSLLDEGYFPQIVALAPIASESSAGTTLECMGKKWTVLPLDEASFAGADVASFSVGDALSKEWVPRILEKYPAIKIVDKSNAFRMDPSVPLVVGGVNDAAVPAGCRLAANPNCTTIQLALSIKPLQDAFGVRRVIVSTYQSVSGGGRECVDSLMEELSLFEQSHDPLDLRASGFAHNVIPQIGSFADDGCCGEETKIIRELKKILGADEMHVSAASARVDAIVGHSMNVWVTLGRDASIEEVEAALKSAFAIDYFPNSKPVCPTPVSASRPGYDLVQVGRLRRVHGTENEFAFFNCANNLRIGAALNAIRIARNLIGAGATASHA
ncbi:MAG: aspartate-semialdehyde dehydrogenase [bacterium]|jgi:aspartate-semialdehyde dehydrogenase